MADETTTTYKKLRHERDELLAAVEKMCSVMSQTPRDDRDEFDAVMTMIDALRLVRGESPAKMGVLEFPIAVAGDK